MGKMGKPSTLNSPHMISLMVGEEHLDILSKNVGSGGRSAFIRDCILLRAKPQSETEKEEELRVTKEELLITKNELSQFQNREKKQKQGFTDRHDSELEQLENNYVMYTTGKTQLTPSNINNWIHARTKDTTISVDEAYLFLGITDTKEVGQCLK